MDPVVVGSIIPIIGVALLALLVVIVLRRKHDRVKTEPTLESTVVPMQMNALYGTDTIVPRSQQNPYAALTDHEVYGGGVATYEATDGMQYSIPVDQSVYAGIYATPVSTGEGYYETTRLSDQCKDGDSKQQLVDISPPAYHTLASLAPAEYHTLASLGENNDGDYDSTVGAVHYDIAAAPLPADPADYDSPVGANPYYEAGEEPPLDDNGYVEAMVGTTRDYEYENAYTPVKDHKHNGTTDV